MAMPALFCTPNQTGETNGDGRIDRRRIKERVVKKERVV